MIQLLLIYTTLLPMTILLNDILNLKDLENTKIRFLMKNRFQDPLYYYQHDRKRLFDCQFWNINNKVFRPGKTAIGFLPIGKDKWLLFDISKITKDLEVLGGVGYEYEQMNEYEKYFGKVVIEYHQKYQTVVNLANTVIRDCKVLQILEDTYDVYDIFPGYENVNISWKEMQNILNKGVWKTALEKQKGVYLITDKRNGKMYVGAAYGEDMIYGRWSTYIKNGHGGNKELRKKGFSYIKDNFCYSILDIYKSTTPDPIIRKRESWWKETLQTRGKFGYNKN